MHYKALNDCFVPQYESPMVINSYHQFSLVAFLCSLLVFSVILNFIIIWTIIFNKKLHSSTTNLVLIWSFFNNVLLTIFVLPIWIWQALNPTMRLPCRIHVANVFFVYQYISGYFMTLTVVSFSRYLQSRSRNVTGDTRKKAKRRFLILSGCILITSLSWSTYLILKTTSYLLIVLASTGLVVSITMHLLVRSNLKVRIQADNNEATSATKNYVDKVIIWFICSILITWLPSSVFGAMSHTYSETSVEIKAITLFFARLFVINIVIEPLVYFKTNMQTRTYLLQRLRLQYNRFRNNRTEQL